MTTYEEVKPKLAASAFRSRFRLTAADRAYIAERGWQVIEAQAARIVAERLAPASPENDGRQTPMRGHPVFKAQHAVAACCRGCLSRWYRLPPGRPLTAGEQAMIVRIILAWLAENAGDLSAFASTPALF